MPSTVVEQQAEDDAQTRLTEPLTYDGLLDAYQSNDLTPVIGRVYHDL